MECKVQNKKGGNVPPTDLIDTLWNVKLEALTPKLKNPVRFNRYIVECKEIIGNRLDSYAFDLIDTLWNVKMQLMQAVGQLRKDLIDTLWNVK